MTSLAAEVARRRTFAIISHPDAGKTTLTEKLLLYAGAIELAGAVRGRKDRRAATSDWMELEKGQYDFESPEMKAVYRYLDAFEQAGTEVLLNFGWKVGERVHDWFLYPGVQKPYESAPADLDAYGRSASALLDELINSRGYDNIGNNQMLVADAATSEVRAVDSLSGRPMRRSRGRRKSVSRSGSGSPILESPSCMNRPPARWWFKSVST